LQRRPGHFWAGYLLSVCQLRLDRPREARASLRACLAQRPDFAYAYLARGLAHLRQGQKTTGAEAAAAWAAAEADFDRALLLAPNRYARYGALVNRGVARLQGGNADGAVADLRQAAALLPDQYPAHVNLAQAYQRQKKWDEAVAVCDRAAEVLPRSGRVRSARARLALARGDDAAALRDLVRAAQLEPPGLAEDHAERGRILHRAGRLPEALAAYDEALKLDPTSADAHHWHRWRGEGLTGLGRHAEAAEAYTRCLLAGGANADVLWARGQSRARLGEHAAAVGDFTQALGLRLRSAATRAAIHTDRGWAYLNREGWKLALDDFEGAARLDLDYAPAQIGKGYARAKLGQYRQAAADAERAAWLGPRTPANSFNLACLFAQAAAGADADRSAPDREALARRYRSRAAEWLRDALERTHEAERRRSWRDYAADPDLDPIRGGEAFRRLEGRHAPPGPPSWVAARRGSGDQRRVSASGR
jgi:tetratricopeptide (TPR) repeat protein